MVTVGQSSGAQTCRPVGTGRGISGLLGYCHQKLQMQAPPDATPAVCATARKINREVLSRPRAVAQLCPQGGRTLLLVRHQRKALPASRHRCKTLCPRREPRHPHQHPRHHQPRRAFAYGLLASPSSSRAAWPAHPCAGAQSFAAFPCRSLSPAPPSQPSLAQARAQHGRQNRACARPLPLCGAAHQVRGRSPPCNAAGLLQASSGGCRCWSLAA
mmetsp:Transcript_9710/g.28693  ORF Transcript_9710/g.28693 Transcript_9710/m.28693 type:complete len:215 (-) Transcript_9710:726-1370(-)